MEKLLIELIRTELRRQDLPAYDADGNCEKIDGWIDIEQLAKAILRLNFNSESETQETRRWP